jgi:D-alanine-D-alanine ligase
MYDPNSPRILVALGGRSSEREVSISSGRQVAEALEKLGYQTGIIDIVTGKLLQTPELDTIEKDPTKLQPVVNFPLIDITRHFSLVFIAMHGRFGEDGGLQALLDEIEMKYTGSGALSSALAMNKHFAKIILKAAGIPTADYQLIKSEKDHLEIGFPLVVKPVSEGSSFGVAICQNQADYDTAIKFALRYGTAMAEPYLGEKEITVPVLEDDQGKPQALPVIEIVPKNKFYDNKSKYDGTTEKIVPARISVELTKKAQELAVATHKALGCRHFSRTDMIIEKSGEISVLELNSIPGLTPESLFPKSAKAEGLDFEKLIDHLVKIVLK